MIKTAASEVRQQPPRADRKRREPSVDPRPSHRRLDRDDEPPVEPGHARMGGLPLLRRRRSQAVPTPAHGAASHAGSLRARASPGLLQHHAGRSATRRRWSARHRQRIEPDPAMCSSDPDPLRPRSSSRWNGTAPRWNCSVSSTGWDQNVPAAWSVTSRCHSMRSLRNSAPRSSAATP